MNRAVMSLILCLFSISMINGMEKEQPTQSITFAELPKELQLYILASGDLTTIKKNIIYFSTVNPKYQSLVRNPNTLAIIISTISNNIQLPLVYIAAYLAIDAPQWLHDGILYWLTQQWKNPNTKNKIAQSMAQTINTMHDRFTTNADAIKLLTFLKKAGISLADINQSGIKQGNMLFFRALLLPKETELNDLNVDLFRILLQLGIKYPLLEAHLTALSRKYSETVDPTIKNEILLRLIALLRSYKHFPQLYSPDVAKTIEVNALLNMLYERM